MIRAFRERFLRTVVAVFALLPILAGGAAAPPSPPDRQTRHDSLRAIADDYWQFYLRENPESATALGEYKYNARLTDYSLAHVDVVRTEAAALLARAQAIDTAGLSDSDRLDQQLLVRTLAEQLESIRLKNYEMPVDQFNGMHLLCSAVRRHRAVRQHEHYDDYVARLNQVPPRSTS